MWSSRSERKRSVGLVKEKAVLVVVVSVWSLVARGAGRVGSGGAGGWDHAGVWEALKRTVFVVVVLGVRGRAGGTVF